MPAIPAASSRIFLRDFGFSLIRFAICPCRTSEGEFEPVDESAKSILTSLANTSLSSILYMEPDSRLILRIISIFLSLDLKGNTLGSKSSNSRTTSANALDGLKSLPPKTTSSMPSPLMEVGLFSPITHLKASKRFDFPQPLGPTIPVSPGKIISSVGSTKLLKPLSRNLVKFNAIS